MSFTYKIILLYCYYLIKILSQEIAKEELSNLIESRVNLENEIRELETKSEKLEKLYEEQEELLREIFGGAYGSENENR